MQKKYKHKLYIQNRKKWNAKWLRSCKAMEQREDNSSIPSYSPFSYSAIDVKQRDNQYSNVISSQSNACTSLIRTLTNSCCILIFNDQLFFVYKWRKICCLIKICFKFKRCDSNFEVKFSNCKIATNETSTGTLHETLCTRKALENYNNNDQQSNRHDFRWQFLSWPMSLGLQ